MSKMMGTKWVVLVLFILMFSLGTGVHNAYANEQETGIDNKAVISGSGSWQNPLVTPTEQQQDRQYTILSTTEAANLTEVKSAVQQGLIQRQTSFSIHYTGDTSNLEANLHQLIDEILVEDDYLNYSRTEFRYGFEGYTNDVTISFTASYVNTREQEDFVEQQVPIILAQIISPEMSPLKKVKTINDYMVLNCTYSDTTSDPGISPHSAYALLLEGRGVCQGYALLAYKMLQQTGVPVHIIVGDAGGGSHAWNLVQINNQWYHLDVTWNDPLPDHPGQVNYNYFLRDNTISNDHSWNTSFYPATADNSYAYFHVMLDASSQGDTIYYRHQTYGNQLYRSSIDGTELQQLNSNRSYYITVANDWIYYSNYSNRGYLYKIRPDGSGESSAVEKHCINTYFKDNILYYTDVESGTIKTIPPTYAITTITEPVDGGTVSGAGSYLEGEIITLTAAPNPDYNFVNWSENEISVSTEASYSFTVSSDRTLVAVFAQESPPVVLEVWPAATGYELHLRELADNDAEVYYAKVYQGESPYAGSSGEVLVEFNRQPYLTGFEYVSLIITEAFPVGNYVMKFYTDADRTVSAFDHAFSVDPMVHITSPGLHDSTTTEDITITGYISNYASASISSLQFQLNSTAWQDIKAMLNEAGSFSIPVTLQPANNRFEIKMQYTSDLTAATNHQIWGEVTLNLDECFIATAAYGSKFTPAVTLLRHFRDDFLMTNNWGIAFVNFYYNNSPSIANYIAGNGFLKATVRLLLTPIVIIVYALYHSTESIAALLALFALLVYWRKRRLTIE